LLEKPLDLPGRERLLNRGLQLLVLLLLLNLDRGLFKTHRHT
jgi:hypothetical protein